MSQQRVSDDFLKAFIAGRGSFAVEQLPMLFAHNLLQDRATLAEQAAEIARLKDEHESELKHYEDYCGEEYNRGFEEGELRGREDHERFYEPKLKELQQQLSALRVVPIDRAHPDSDMERAYTAINRLAALPSRGEVLEKAHPRSEIFSYNLNKGERVMTDKRVDDETLIEAMEHFKNGFLFDPSPEAFRLVMLDLNDARNELKELIKMVKICGVHPSTKKEEYDKLRAMIE